MMLDDYLSLVLGQTTVSPKTLIVSLLLFLSHLDYCIELFLDPLILLKLNF